MKILCYSYDDTQPSELSIELISRGYEPVTALNETEVLEKLDKKNIDAFITEIGELSFINKVRENAPETLIFFIYHSSMPNDHILELNKIGITALIHYSEDVAELADEITDFILRNGLNKLERRKHTRFAPAPYETILTSIFLKEHKRYVKIPLNDISMGGLSVKLPNSSAGKIFQNDSIYNPIFMDLRGMITKVIARCVDIRGEHLAFKFENVTQSEVRKIAYYLNARISENDSMVFF